MSIGWIHPSTRQPLALRKDRLVDSTGTTQFQVISGIPRFVTPEQNYAESFGWQWKRWEHTRSEARGGGEGLPDVLRARTHFDEYDLRGKTLLECGMGGGDDTEVLLRLPLSELHAFDLSTSVERAAKHLKDPRLSISQASIFEIPYPDSSFDVVYCHRVLQHTPDPARALRCVCRKVKPGGILFAHSYRRSWKHMMEWRYKYRWIAKRLSRERVFNFLERHGKTLHKAGHWLRGHGRLLRVLGYSFFPFYVLRDQHPHEHLVELEKLITFDALTPWHDHPMTTRTFVGIIRSEGFRIDHLRECEPSPVYCTARRTD